MNPRPIQWTIFAAMLSLANACASEPAGQSARHNSGGDAGYSGYLDANAAAGESGRLSDAANGGGGASQTGGEAGLPEGAGSAGLAGKSGASGTAGASGTSGTAGAAGDAVIDGPAFMPPFIIGADISIVPQKETEGTTFKDVDGSAPSGTTSTGGGILTILKNHGFNYIRLRTFVNPAASGGYSAQGYCDRDHTIEFGKGIKRAGMGFLLDFHYSDTWADPDDQAKPVAWAGLTFTELTVQVYDYTKDVIAQLKADHARPDIVQIGNEIPQGLLFDASGAVGGTGGKVSGQTFAKLAALLKAGIKGVKDVDANIKIMMHLDRCDDLAVNTWWLGTTTPATGVLGEGVQFDILGESCYDQADYQEPPSAWAPTFSSLAAAYPNLTFIAVEYSTSKQLVNETIFNIPNKRGLGAFIWEPTYWSETLFDSSGKALSQYMSIYDTIAATYGQR
jgi:arabinogalactan endo-1,4-beta-galactosidase